MTLTVWFNRIDLQYAGRWLGSSL